MAEGEVKTSSASMPAHDFCLRSVVACCEMPPTFIVNSTHQLNDFFPLLEERQREVCSPQTQTVVLLTISQPINAVLNARKRLASNFRALEDAMWIVYVGDFVDNFRRTALRCGTIDGDMRTFPVWKTQDYGMMALLTPLLEDQAYLTLHARRYWRHVQPQIHSVRPGSMPRMPHVRPPSAESSGALQAVVLPTDAPATKKP